MSWRLIASECPPRDRPVFVAGGRISDDNFDFELHDHWPRHTQTAPVRAQLMSDDFRVEAYWLVSCYDGGVCTIEYESPTHWMEIPPL